MGITGNEEAMEKYFLIAPALCTIVSDFKEYAGIQSHKSSSIHHQMVGTKSTTMLTNTLKLYTFLMKNGNPLFKSDVHNLTTFAVVPNDISINIEKRDELGRKALEAFVDERIVQKSIPFWDPQKKNNFKYFKDVGSIIQKKVNGKEVSIQ